MNPSPISLINYFITELSVIAKSDFDPERAIEGKMDEFSAEVSLQKLSAEEAEDQEHWQLTLSVSNQPSPEANFPYEFKIELMGLFDCFLEDLDPEEEERQMRINGASMLYGVAREAIRANTSRGPWTPIMIPTISFYEPKADSIVSESDDS